MTAFAVKAFDVVPFAAAAAGFTMKHAAHDKWPVGIIVSEGNQYLNAGFGHANKSPVFSAVFTAARVGGHYTKPVGEFIILLPEHLHAHPAHIIGVLVVFYIGYLGFGNR